MAETHYRYSSDCTEPDIEHDELYDYVLEREDYRKLASTGPKCMKNFKDMKEVDEMNEHFTPTESKSWIKNIIIIAIILIALYYIYTLFCKKDDTPIYNYGQNIRYVFRE
jgi:hypothetical protein